MAEETSKYSHHSQLAHDFQHGHDGDAVEKDMGPER